MRGKKINQEFVAEFISDAVKQGIETPIDMVASAKKQIEMIDLEIKAIEEKKLLRCRLLDVVLTFEKQIKTTSEDAKLLPFFDLKYPAECKEICGIIKEHKIIPIHSWRTHMADGFVVKFCHKQLLECKILQRKDDTLIKGERFDEYMKFVLREV